MLTLPYKKNEKKKSRLVHWEATTFLFVQMLGNLKLDLNLKEWGIKVKHGVGNPSIK